MPGTKPTLIVVGQVETSAGNLQPRLEPATPQGFNPAILLLNLTIVDTGKPATEDIAFRDVRFETPASQGQFSHAEIHFEGESCVSMEVTEAH